VCVCVCDEEKGGRWRGEIERKSGGGCDGERTVPRRKGSQQSLYRFEDRLQSSIVAILRNPNNLSFVRTTARATYHWNRNLQPLALPSGQYSLFSVTRRIKKPINENLSLYQHRV